MSREELAKAVDDRRTEMEAAHAALNAARDASGDVEGDLDATEEQIATAQAKEQEAKTVHAEAEQAYEAARDALANCAN